MQFKIGDIVCITKGTDSAVVKIHDLSKRIIIFTLFGKLFHLDISEHDVTLVERAKVIEKRWNWVYSMNNSYYITKLKFAKAADFMVLNETHGEYFKIFGSVEEFEVDEFEIEGGGNDNF